MRVSGKCNICGTELDDTSHNAQYKCPHARRLWGEVRKVWNLPEDRDLQIEPYHLVADSY
jgi:DNA-directed RNA polymerase subunit RPC12/RpoP